MARKSDIQYIQFYTDGSAARELTPRISPRKMLSRVVQPIMQKDNAVKVYPLELCAVAVSAVMLVLLVVGMFSLRSANTELETMRSYVQTLQAENTQLQAQHDEIYDLKSVEQTALAIGMVPVDQVEHVTMQVVLPAAEEEPSFWENVGALFTGLFA